jgi:hypothetical protein
MLLVAGLIVGYFGVVVPDGVGTSYTTGSTQTHRQAFGSTFVTAVPTVPGRSAAVITIDKYAGTTCVYVVPGASVSVDARLGDGSVTIESTPAAGGDTKYTDVTSTSRTEAGDRFTWTGPTVKGAAASASPAQVRIDQDHGSVIIEVTEQSK